MGFFSKLFKKSENTQPVSTTNTNVKISVATSAQDIPPLQGDYAKTIFLWANSKASPIKNNDSYPRYLLYECGIKNAAKYHKDLIASGYFEEASVEQVLNSLKVTELKNILISLGITTTGKKEELILRITNNADDSVIAHYCQEKLYILSPIGQTFLQEHNDYVLVHKHQNWGISWQEYDAKRISGQSYYDTMWAIFNEQLVNNHHDYGRTQYLYMYQLLNEENKRERALRMLLQVLYIDLSGVDGIQWYDMYRQGLYSTKKVRDCFDTVITLAPGIIDSIKKFDDIYTDDIIDKIYEQQLPVQICNKKLFSYIIHSVIEGTYDKEVTEEKLKQAYYKYLRENLFK